MSLQIQCPELATGAPVVWNLLNLTYELVFDLSSTINYTPRLKESRAGGFLAWDRIPNEIVPFMKSDCLWHHPLIYYAV